MNSICAADLEPLCRFVAKRDAAGAMTSLLVLIRRRVAQQQHKADASVSDVAAGIHAHAVQALRQASMLPPGDCRNRTLPALRSTSPPPLPWEECHESFHFAMIENIASMNRCKLDSDASHVAHAMVAVACLGGWTRAQFQSISVAAFRAPFFTRHPAWLLVLLIVLSNFDAAVVSSLSVPAHLSGWAARAVLSAKEEFGTAFDGTIESTMDLAVLHTLMNSLAGLFKLSRSDMVACLCKARHVQWPLAPATGKLHAQPSVYSPYSELQAAEIALALQPAAESALQQIMRHYRARDVDLFIATARAIYDQANAGAEALRAAFAVIEIRFCRNGDGGLSTSIDADRGRALWVCVLEKCLAAWVDMALVSLAASSSEPSGDQGGSSNGSNSSNSGMASVMSSAAFGLYQFLLIRAVCMLRRLPSPPLDLVERVRRSLEKLLASERIVAYHTEHVLVHTYWICVSCRISPDSLHRGSAPHNWVASAAAHRGNRKYSKHILQQLFGASRHAG